jgi:hypothetical protein
MSVIFTIITNSDVNLRGNHLEFKLGSPLGYLCCGLIMTGVWDQNSGFGGLGVSMLASGTQDRGFAPDRSRRIFPAGKIYSMPSLRGEVKESVPCPSFGAC